MKTKIAIGFAMVLFCAQSAMAFEGQPLTLAEKLKNVETLAASAAKAPEWFDKCSIVIQLEEMMVLDREFMTVDIVKSGLRSDISLAVRHCESPSEEKEKNPALFAEGTQATIPNRHNQLTASLVRIQADAHHLLRGLK